jgi:hypothetical protein
MKTQVFLLMPLLLLAACPSPAPPCPSIPTPSPTVLDAASPVGSTLTVHNQTKKDTVVYVAFGANSVVLPASWPFCTASAKLNCSFKLGAELTQEMPLSGQYLNATFAFDASVGCGATKGEMNVNTSNASDTFDISLVDGFSNNMTIQIENGASKKLLGPLNGAKGNERLDGVFPLGCDLCVAQQVRSCSIVPATCKAGTQYDPKPPCQYQGLPSSHITLSLVYTRL